MAAPARLIRLGVTAALVSLVLDQITKVWAMSVMQDAGSFALPLLPFLDIVSLWNRGISYGLFQQGDTGRWLLVGIKVVAVVVFSIWLTRAHRRLEAVALGLLIGGAIGNAVDRVIYGAVYDFISLHAFGYRWYVFNVADIAVVIGVLLLLIDAFRGGASKSPPSDSEMESTPETERKP